MRLPPFRLERWFARWEFTVRHNLCASDVEGVPLAELLALADEDSRRRWDALSLGYTESAGHPLLRAEIARLYETVTPDDVLVFSGAQEGILLALHAALAPGDHAIVVWPAYQSLHEVARAAGADVSFLRLRHERGWAVELDELRALVTPRTRAIVVNFPHSPTGALPDVTTFRAIAAVAEEAGALLFSDEVYRELEVEPADRLPAGADLAGRTASLGVLSKAYGLAGLRIGWLATRDRALLERIAALKDYTTICASAPSELLAIVALRARAHLVARSRAVLADNLRRLDAFFAAHPDDLEWIRPRGGSVGFPRLLRGAPVDAFTDALVAEEGVLLLPGTLFDQPGHMRLGFGRRDLAAGLDRLGAFLARRAASHD